MKRFIQSLLLIVLSMGIVVPAWGQASTEGREFWVALNMTTGTGGDVHEPFICITTQYPGGSYTITNPADPSFTPITGLIPPTGYVKIVANTNPSNNQIDLNKWYPVGQTAQAVSNQIKNVGLKVTTTVDCSVFAGNRLPQSFDAANILPITALQTDYITQDYPGYDHENKGGGYPVTTILATEDNTSVTVTPTSAVLNNNGTSPITKILNAGQVLYVTGDNRASLSGTTVKSNKKIAVFTGVNNTDVPGPVSARDHLYEQNMPVDYWGTHFVVTRSMKKDANRIRVTASNNGTELIIDGISMATINAGETYEFELCEETMRKEDGYTKAKDEGRGTDYYLDGEAHYLETSCPCAVFSYDVSENYYIKKNGTSERDDNSAGDPAMVWISPLEQQLNKVTFGVMNTDKTPTHYVNIITPTNGASSLEVREVAMNAGQVVYGNNLVQPTDVKIVPGNPAYSYARIKLTENAESVYTITSDVGFIAHVYGSGTKESYAYSCGSAAVQQGVRVDGETFINGYRSETKFCSGAELTFDAKIGTDEITRVDWDFGDGTTDYNGAPFTTHTYNIPGWYDVTADLYGHQVCTDEDNIWLGSVSFTFRVWRHDTIIVPPSPDDKVCFDTLQTEQFISDYGMDSLKTLLANGKRQILNPDAPCYENRKLSLVPYGIDTKYEFSAQGRDSLYVNGQWYSPETLPADGVIKWTIENGNQYGCDSFVTCHAKIITCLSLEIYNNPDAQHMCLFEENSVAVVYEKFKGEIKDEKGVFTINELPSFKADITISDANVKGTLLLPMDAIKKPGYYTGKIRVEDPVCTDQPWEFTLNFTVLYPSNIFKLKFNNVLVVYQPGYGGNAELKTEFTNYQWYRNGAPVLGATGSILYLGQGVTFNEGDVVYVELTDKNGLTLPSCPQELHNIPDYTQQPNNAPAHKVIQNQKIVILRDEKTYNIYGQRVQ